MRYLRPVLYVLVMIIPAAAMGASREIVQLQRDVAILQDQIRTLQRTLDEKVAALTVLTEQSLDRMNQVNTSVAVLQSGLNDQLRNQEKTLASPVAGMNTKLDQMSSEFQYVQESVRDLTARMTKLEAQISDLAVAMRTVNAPPGPPSISGAGAFGSPTGGPPAGMTPKALYDNAYRDKIGGNLDLAMQQFNDYLQYFGSTDLAPNAQFYVGEIFYNKGQYDQALGAFDMVLEKYQENNKTPDAFYMKGMTLVKMGQRTRGAEEFYELLRRFPRDELAAKARTQLRNLGLSTTPPRRPARG
jgi:tol-pal system protein YbgF